MAQVPWNSLFEASKVSSLDTIPAKFLSLAGTSIHGEFMEPQWF
jgi:hypothetical protein